jgi:hypothetical protein
MDGQAVKQIIDLASERMTLELPDGTYARGSFHKVIPEVSHPASFELTTLASFVELVNQNPQGFDLAGAVVTIDDGFCVNLLSPPRQDGHRDRYVSTQSPIRPFAFGQWYGLNSFNIALLTLFVQDDKLFGLFRLMQEIKVEDGATIHDNGTSLSVTVKHGVSAASASMEQIPSIVRLKPYRYFSEVEQIEVPLLLRLRQDDDDVLACLMECDGGAWKVAAYQVITRKLKQLGCKLPIYC